MFQGKQVCIDIAKTKGKGKYIDSCSNEITIREESPLGIKGYKRYTHSFSSDYSISGINYNGDKQNGFDDIEYYNRKVTVYYLSYDESNALPLIVGLEKNWGNDNYYYHERTDPLVATSSWKTDLDVKEESDLSKKFKEISTKLNRLVLLRVNKTKNNDTYYADGTDSAPTDSTFKIEVNESEKVDDRYIKFTHKALGGSQIRLLSTKTTFISIPFEPPVYGSNYNEASVYYWNGDSGYSIPLLLELKPASNTPSYYILSGEGIGKRWTKDSNTPSTLKEKLDKQNCSRNDAHVALISEATKPGYTCPNCPKHVKVTKESTSGYFYSLYHGSFYRFKDGETEQTGFTFTGKISDVYVYNYPLSDGIPLLIYYSSNWYQRKSLDSNSWTDVGGVIKPVHPFDNTNIPRLLKAILPTVTIDLGKTNATSGKETTYPDPSERAEGVKEKIKVERKNLEEGYTSFTHCVDKKEGFILGGVKYGEGTAFSGLSSSFILKSVTAYYSGEDGFKLDNLLLVGFEKRGTGSNNYEYYIRGDEDNDGTTWTVLEGFGKTEKLENTELTTKLKELKEKLEKKKSKGQEAGGLSGPGDGDGQGSVTYSIQKFFEQILDTIRSKPAEIGGGVGGTIGTGIFGALAMWKGPALIAKLITRL